MRMAYCCHGLDTLVLLLSVLWTLSTTCLMYHNTDNNIFFVSQQWQQHVLCITTMTTICLACHNAINNMSYVVLWYVRHIVVNIVIPKRYCCQYCDTYDVLLSYVSQQWQQYVLRATTLLTICLTYHNTDNNMSDVSQPWQKYVYVWHIVVMVVIRQTYCYQCCDT
jgi:FlaA1/EpsC-like NDP-sugar epimerase